MGVKYTHQPGALKSVIQLPTRRSNKERGKSRGFER